MRSRETILAKEHNIAFFFQNFFTFAKTKDEKGQTTKKQSPLPLSLLSDLHQSMVTTALSFPHSYPRYILFKALEKVEDRERVGWTLPFLKAKLHQGANKREGLLDYYDCLSLELLLKEYKETSVSVVDKSEENFTFYTTLLSSFYLYKVVNSDGVQEKEEAATEENSEKKVQKKVELLFSPILVLLPNLTSSFFSLFSLPRRQTLFKVLTDLLLPSKSKDISIDVSLTLSTTTMKTSLGLVSTFNVAEVKEKAREVIKALPVSPAFVNSELREAVDELLATQGQGDQQRTKRQKTGQPPAVTAEKKVFPPRLTVLLELFQYKPEVLDHTHVGPLFSILSSLVDPVLAVLNPSFEYTQQLLLSSLISITQAIVKGSLNTTPAVPTAAIDDEDVDMETKPAPVPEEKSEVPPVKLSKKQINDLSSLYNASAIIDCIRVSTNPTIHNNCLLLLSTVALLYPSKVLSHIMSIFTFMGLSTKRSDDNYTFLVLQRTIESVVPAILGSTSSVPVAPSSPARRLAAAPGSSGSADLGSGRGIAIETLISTMVEHAEEIPQHRKMLVFSILMKTLGYKYLPLLYALFFTRFRVLQEQQQKPGQQEQQKEQEQKKGGLATEEDEQSSGLFSHSEKFFGFMHQLTLKFSPFHAIHAFVFLLHNLYVILDENDKETNEEFSVRALKLKNAIDTEADDNDNKHDAGTKQILASILAKSLSLKQDKSKHLVSQSIRKVMLDVLSFFNKYLTSESLLGQLLAMPDTMEKRLQGLCHVLLEVL